MKSPLFALLVAILTPAAAWMRFFGGNVGGAHSLNFPPNTRRRPRAGFQPNRDDGPVPPALYAYGRFSKDENTSMWKANDHKIIAVHKSETDDFTPGIQRRPKDRRD